MVTDIGKHSCMMHITESVYWLHYSSPLVIRSALSLSSCTKTCDVFFINHSPNYKSVSLLYQGVNTSYLGLIVLLVTLWRHFYKPRLIIQSLHPEWVQRRTRLKEGRPAGTNIICSSYVIQLQDNHHLRVTAKFKLSTMWEVVVMQNVSPPGSTPYHTTSAPLPRQMEGAISPAAGPPEVYISPCLHPNKIHNYHKTSPLLPSNCLTV